jgi:hypothetical protein
MIVTSVCVCESSLYCNEKITFASHFVVCDVSDLSFSFSVRAMRALL